MIDHVTREQLTKTGMMWLKLQFATSQDQFDMLFSEMSSMDYITLTMLSDKLGLSDSRVYLKDIASELNMPMNQVSGRVNKMQERGLVYWKHDEGGTYITISEIGVNAMTKQRDRLIRFLEMTIDRVGYEQFAHIVELRMQLNRVMDQVVEEL